MLPRACMREITDRNDFCIKAHCMQPDLQLTSCAMFQAGLRGLREKTHERPGYDLGHSFHARPLRYFLIGFDCSRRGGELLWLHLSPFAPPDIMGFGRTTAHELPFGLG